MSKLILVRHTAVARPLGTFYGHTDVPLADSAETDIAQTVAQLQPLISGPTKLITSPLTRSLLLAQALVPVAGNLLKDDRLKELHFGQWEDKHFDDLPKKQLQAWMDDFVNARTPDGESFQDLQDRVVAAYYDARAAFPKKTLIMVCHAGPIRALLAHWYKTALAQAFDYKVAFGEAIVLD